MVVAPIAARRPSLRIPTMVAHLSADHKRWWNGHVLPDRFGTGKNRPDEREPAGSGPAVGHAHVLRPLVGAGLERPLPAEPGPRPDRPLHRLRPADPVRVRPRRPRGGG